MAPAPSSGKKSSGREPRKNEKGLIVNWDSTWPDAVYLRTLVENGDVDGLTAGQVQAAYTQFKQFANKALTGGLKTIRTSVQEETNAARGPGSNGMLLVIRHSSFVIRHPSIFFLSSFDSPTRLFHFQLSTPDRVWTAILLLLLQHATFALLVELSLPSLRMRM